MKFSHLIAALVIATLPTPAFALMCPSSLVPPASVKVEAPVVDFDVKVASKSDILRFCGTNASGCAWPVNWDWSHHTTVNWHILINDLIPEKYRECVFVYELSHLPPNNWLDPNIESFKNWDDVIKNAPRGVPPEKKTKK